MRAQLVLTLIGPDRPGLVEALAVTVARHGGNWEESRMARLAGKFAGILRVTVPVDAASALIASLHGLEREGLKLTVESSEPSPDEPGGRRLRLELLGNDREGIVRDISSTLAVRKVNVEELETTCEEAPMGGGQLFRAEAVLYVPGAVALEELRSTLESLADDLMVELSLVESL
jgi:glycine cleavage system regulatory protein